MQSAYANDGRVTAFDGEIYVVSMDDEPGVSGPQDGRVQPAENGSGYEAFAWSWEPEPVKRCFKSPDEAIHWLIGDPQS